MSTPNPTMNLPADAPKHSTYEANATKWRFSRLMYTGEAFDPVNVRGFIIQRKQGEHDKSYEERIKPALCDPALDYGLVIDSLVGMCFTAEAKTTRTWFEANDAGAPSRRFNMGSPEERGTVAHRVWRNASGDGKGLIDLLKEVAAVGSTRHFVWGLVDNAVIDERGAVIKPVTLNYIDPELVINHRYENGRLVEAVVVDQRDKRTSIFETDQSDAETVLVQYTLEGWREVDAKGMPVAGPAGQLHEYAFYAGDDTNAPRCLPLFRVPLPMLRNVGYLMARKCAAIANTESEIDAYGRLTNLPRLGIADDVSESEALENIAAGKSWFRIPTQGNISQFISPPSDHMAVRMKRLEMKRADFMVQSFREYGRSTPGEETATARRQDWAAGVAAYLTQLAGFLQRFEREGMRRYEQAEYGNAPDAWGQYDVNRSTDFKPEDIREVMNDLIGRLFGRNIPVPDDTAADIVVDFLDAYGIETTAEAVTEKMQTDADTAERYRDALGAAPRSGGRPPLQRAA